VSFSPCCAKAKHHPEHVYFADFSEAEQNVEHKMSEEQVEEAPELEEFVPQVDTPDDDSLIESEHQDKGTNSTAHTSVVTHPLWESYF
jgi:hypothetical protein